MRIYKTEEIRNIALLGHYSHGKTTLLEAIANFTGLTNRMGTVEDGNTISDFGKEEIAKKFSISATLVPIEWNNIKFNFIDTPGLIDFSAEAIEAISATDLAIIVVDARKGLESGTINAWKLCEKFSRPRLFFLTGIDDVRAKCMDTIEQLKDVFGKRLLHFTIQLWRVKSL